MIIKYDAEGNKVWGVSVGGSGEERITDIAETSDGGIVVGGCFKSTRIELDDRKVLEKKSSSSYSFTGMIIKYDAEGNTVWAESIGGDKNDEIKAIAETSDGGIVARGDFKSSRIVLDNGQVLEKKRWI